MLTVVNLEEPTPATVSEPAVTGGSLIDEIVRDGARRMLAAALEAEVAAYIAAHADQLDDNGSAYPVPKGTVVGPSYDPRFLAGDWQYGVNVWYSPTCQTNWAVARLTGGNQTQCGISVSTKIRREAGPDGGYQMWHAGWTTTCSYDANIIVSPMVWSPDNLAQACGSLAGDDQTVCTVPL